MATNFQLRLLVIVPAAKVAAVAGWLQANIDPTAAPADLGPALNPTGLAGDPVTHRWLCGAFVDADAKAILAKLCQLAAVVPPTGPQWAGWTKAEKIVWLKSVQAALLAGYGVYVGLMGNADAWDSPNDALAVMGLKRVATP